MSFQRVGLGRSMTPVLVISHSTMPRQTRTVATQNRSHGVSRSPVFKSWKAGRKQQSRIEAIKFIESFEAEVQLEPTARKDLEDLLGNPTFCKQVAAETRQEHGITLEYSGHLFQPVPWSPSTQKGMPAEFEKYHDDPLYVTINVPPNFMFQAKIFKPSRLCAFYKRGV